MILAKISNDTNSQHINRKNLMILSCLAIPGILSSNISPHNFT